MNYIQMENTGKENLFDLLYSVAALADINDMPVKVKCNNRRSYLVFPKENEDE